MKKIIYFLLLICFAFNSNSYAQKGKTKKFDYGKVENNKYTNSYFGLELIIPENWVVKSKEETKVITDAGKKIIASNNENLKEVIEAAEVNSAYLLHVNKYEQGAPVDYNSSFLLLSENVTSSPGVKTGADYLFHTRKLLLQTQLKFTEIDEEFKKVIINNEEFYLMNLTMEIMGMEIKQGYYATIKNGFCVAVIISFIDEEQKTELEKMLNTLLFEK